MLGLTALELGRLRMSVGYGTHKKGRPLSPVEVGSLVCQARDAGISLEEFALEVHLKGTSHLGRFLRILKLPHDLQHLIGWGGSRDAIGFSCAFELVRVHDADDQRIVAESILTDGLKSKEVRQVAQLRERSGRPVQECLKEVLGMRTVIDRRYVFIGTIASENVESSLAGLTQLQRDAVLKSVIDELALRGATGRLGQRFFTLVGDERFNASMNDIGKEQLEGKIRTQIDQLISQ